MTDPDEMAEFFDQWPETPASAGTAWDDERGYACCGGYREHRYRCPHRVWPATATPEVRRQAVRGDCIGPAHAEIGDLVPCGLDYQQRKRLTAILARVWDDGCGYDLVIKAQERANGPTSRPASAPPPSAAAAAQSPSAPSPPHGPPGTSGQSR